MRFKVGDKVKHINTNFTSSHGTIVAIDTSDPEEYAYTIEWEWESYNLEDHYGWEELIVVTNGLDRVLDTLE